MRRPLNLSLGDDPTVEEVVRALRQMADGKAMGPDELPSELLKLALTRNHETWLPCMSPSYQCGGKR